MFRKHIMFISKIHNHHHETDTEILLRIQNLLLRLEQYI